MNRKPEVHAMSIHWDQHHGIIVPIILRGIKGEPFENHTMTPTEALNAAERLVHAAMLATR